MYCWNCGKEIEDDQLFCPHCAMKQAGVSEPKPEKKKLPLWPILCMAGCGVLLLLILLVVWLLSAGTPSQPVDPRSVELPDIAAFLNTQYTNDDVSAYTHHVTCELNRDPDRKAVEAVVELLLEDRYQLVLDSSRDHTEGKNLVTDYIFRYTGQNDAIDWVYHKDGYQYHVKLSVYRFPNQDKVTMILYTDPDFILTDPGKEY